MHLEATRILADWFKGDLKDAAGADQSVNTWLKGMHAANLLDGGDAMPELVRNVLDTTRDSAAARGEVAPTAQFPILVVAPDGAADLEPRVRNPLLKRDAERVPFLVRYVTNDLTTAKAEADCWYTLRATLKSLEQLLLDANEAQRTRNHIGILECVALRSGPVFQQLGAAAATGGIEMTFKLRDFRP